MKISKKQLRQIISETIQEAHSTGSPADQVGQAIVQLQTIASRVQHKNVEDAIWDVVRQLDAVRGELFKGEHNDEVGYVD